MMEFNKAKILIVDDNPVNLKLLAKTLGNKDYQVRAAIDGETALISVQESAPDLILLDINMPNMNGYEVAHRIKQDKNNNAIPIIFISALDDTESIVTAFEHGGVDYISKPFQIPEVEARVQTHLTIALQQKLLLDFRERDQLRLIQISQSEARYRDIFDNAHEIIQSVDEQGFFMYVNPYWHHLLGYSEEDLQHMNFTDVVHPDYLEKCMGIFNQITQDSEDVDFINTVFVTKDGQELFVQGNISAYQDGQGFHTRGIFRDVTQQRLAEKDALRLSMEQQRNAVLSDFIRDSSHELRTPLSIIGQQLYMIKRLSENEKQLEKVAIAEAKIKEVDNMINQLHQFTVLSANDDIRLDTVDLSLLIRQILPNIEPLVDEKQVQLQINLDDSVSAMQGDNKLLDTMVEELLINALRYTSAKDEIYIQLTQADDLYLLLTIRDTGIGIAPEHQHQIFEPLYKVNQARTSDGSGAGVGLSMVKRIVELHDGQIQVMSQLDSGTQFNILLPITQP